MVIRKITNLDSNAIFSFESQNFNDGWNSEMINSAFNAGRFFGYLIEDENGEILSLITYSISIDSADIESVVTKVSERKKGYAKLLFNLAIKDITNKKIVKIFLEVRKSNTPAISLYNSLGFSKVGERKKYYADGEDAFVLMKELL